MSSVGTFCKTNGGSSGKGGGVLGLQFSKSTKREDSREQQQNETIMSRVSSDTMFLCIKYPEATVILQIYVPNFFLAGGTILWRLERRGCAADLQRDWSLLCKRLEDQLNSFLSFFNTFIHYRCTQQPVLIDGTKQYAGHCTCGARRLEVTGM